MCDPISGSGQNIVWYLVPEEKSVYLIVVVRMWLTIPIQNFKNEIRDNSCKIKDNIGTV